MTERTLLWDSLPSRCAVSWVCQSRTSSSCSNSSEAGVLTVCAPTLVPRDEASRQLLAAGVRITRHRIQCPVLQLTPEMRDPQSCTNFLSAHVVSSIPIQATIFFHTWDHTEAQEVILLRTFTFKHTSLEGSYTDRNDCPNITHILHHTTCITQFLRSHSSTVYTSLSYIMYTFYINNFFDRTGGTKEQWTSSITFLCSTKLFCYIVWLFDTIWILNL